MILGQSVSSVEDLVDHVPEHGSNKSDRGRGSPLGVPNWGSRLRLPLAPWRVGELPRQGAAGSDHRCCRRPCHRIAANSADMATTPITNPSSTLTTPPSSRSGWSAWTGNGQQRGGFVNGPEPLCRPDNPSAATSTQYQFAQKSSVSDEACTYLGLTLTADVLPSPSTRSSNRTSTFGFRAEASHQAFPVEVDVCSLASSYDEPIPVVEWSHLIRPVGLSLLNRSRNT